MLFLLRGQPVTCHCHDMLSRFFNRQDAVPPVRTVPETPNGAVVWAIGDIHGRRDLLEALLDGIAADIASSSAGQKVVVFLGDYVDRGPDSQGVIDLLCAFRDDIVCEMVFLKGNHEDKLVEFLSDPKVGPQWCEYGGVQALKSFGLTPPSMSHRAGAWTSLSADLSHKLTDRQRRFFDQLRYSYSLGDYFFAHAGARPGIALEDQSPQDLMWVRGAFLHDDGPFEKMVVHGHTPTLDVYIDERRIGLDTKAYASGVLSAIRLEGARRRILQTVQEGREITLRYRDASPGGRMSEPAT